MNLETNPRVAKEIGIELLRVVSSLERDAQIAVLQWAQAHVKRQIRKTAEPVFSRPVHPVTLGHYDAEIQRLKAAGTAYRNMGPYFGCSSKCVVARARVMQEQTQ